MRKPRQGELTIGFTTGLSAGLFAGLEVQPRPPAPTLAATAEAAIASLPPGAALPPIHPGEILAEDFLAEAGLSAIKAAQRMGVPRTRIERLVAGTVAMTPDTALRLERLFGASAEFWMNLQTRHDLDLARAAAAPALAAIEPVTGAARD